MNIAGILVHAAPGRVDAVRTRLTEMPGVEVHATTDEGRLVVTLEEDDDDHAAERVLSFHRIEGVLSAALVYHYFEPDPDDQETRPESVNQETRDAADTA